MRSGRGCPRGIATTDAGLQEQITVEWGSQRIIESLQRMAQGPGRHIEKGWACAASVS